MRAQGQHCCGPGLSPAGFQRPGAPARVCRTCPGLPSFKIKGPEPASIQHRNFFRAYLNAAKVFSKFIFGSLDPFIASGRGGFMET